MDVDGFGFFEPRTIAPIASSDILTGGMAFIS